MNNYGYTEKLVNIDRIIAGDVVMHNNKLITVNKNDIKLCPFMGLTLFGDSYCLGHKKINLVNILHRKPIVNEKESKR